MKILLVKTCSNWKLPVSLILSSLPHILLKVITFNHVKLILHIISVLFKTIMSGEMTIITINLENHTTTFKNSIIL